MKVLSVQRPPASAEARELVRASMAMREQAVALGLDTKELDRLVEKVVLEQARRFLAAVPAPLV